MRFTLYVIKYFLTSFHHSYFRLLYRLFVRISQTFGVAVMVRSFFKPLFGFPGIGSRINGVVVRSVSIIVSMLLLLTLLVSGILFYFVILLSPFYIAYKSVLIGIIYVSSVVLIKRYQFYKEPLRQIENKSDIKEYFLSGGQNLRRILNAISRSDYDYALNLISKNRYAKSYIERLELDQEELFQFLKQGKVGFEKELVLKKIVVLNEQVGFKNVKAELILASIILSTDKDLQYLNKHDLDENIILESLFFIKEIYYREPYLWEEDYELPPAGGVDKGWAVGYTGNLNKYSEDLTKLALEGYMPKLIGREKEKSQIITILSKKSRNNAMVIGEPGCGKTTFVKGLAREIALGTSIPALRYKRLVSLDIGALTSGPIGEINDHISKIIKEIKAAGNIILFVDEIHNLSSTLNTDPNSASVFSALEPHLSNGEFQMIGSTSRKNYYKYIAPNGSFSRVFDLVEMKETNKEETIKIIAHTVRPDEKSQKITLTYLAATKAYELANKYVHENSFPSKAVGIVSQAFAEALGNNRNLVSAEDISRVFAQSINIPVENINEDEREILINLEENLHKKIVGQDVAVKSISDSLKRGRLGVRDENKPIASFLFAGPTGVGKTETAKAISELYFGDKKYMIRIDMSEYQSESSIDRLIGSEGHPGILTSKVRELPFALILLDEIEKADKRVLNLFLQVLDDGRLTNSEGLLVDFSNTFIIMTTNIGTRKVIEVIENGGDQEMITTVALDALKDHFTPEFLNRFTDLVPYKPLTREEVKSIARIKLKKVKMKMAEKRITVEFSDSLLDELVEKGYSQEWGARPINRVIEQHVETSLANLLLSEKISAGSHYTMSQLSE